MRSFQNFVLRKRLEPIICEVAAGMALCNVNPEQWLLNWVRQHEPQTESTILLSFNQLVLNEMQFTEQEGPYPQRGGFLGGLKNFWNSLVGGGKAAASSGVNAYQNLRTQRTEDAFQNAYKYMNALVQALQGDGRLQQVAEIRPIADRLNKMRDELMDLSGQVSPLLGGQQPPPGAPQTGPGSNTGPNSSPVTAEVVPEPHGPGGSQNVATATPGTGPGATSTQTVGGGGNMPSAQQLASAPPGGWNSVFTSLDQPQAGPNVADTGLAKGPAGGNTKANVTQPFGTGRMSQADTGTQAAPGGSQSNTLQPNQPENPFASFSADSGVPGGSFDTSAIDTGTGRPVMTQADTGQAAQGPAAAKRKGGRRRQISPESDAVVRGTAPGLQYPAVG